MKKLLVIFIVSLMAFILPSHTILMGVKDINGNQVESCGFERSNLVITPDGCIDEQQIMSAPGVCNCSDPKNPRRKWKGKCQNDYCGYYINCFCCQTVKCFSYTKCPICDGNWLVTCDGC